MPGPLSLIVARAIRYARRLSSQRLSRLSPPSQHVEGIRQGSWARLAGVSCGDCVTKMYPCSLAEVWGRRAESACDLPGSRVGSRRRCTTYEVVLWLRVRHGMFGDNDEGLWW